MTISIQTSDAISVVSEDVKAHLSLLGAFSKLREAHHARWPAYVKQCVAKFHDWIQKLGVLPDRDPTRVLERNLPDLDVLMVWHTYLLNPVRYHRDSTDSSNALHNLGAFPLSASAKQLADLRRDTLSASPSITHGIGDIKNDIDKFDLVAAVLRQSEFIKKIEALGWTELPSSNQLVSNSILRYCVFLELLANGAVQSLVPTLDIDLVWHTHQMKGSVYCDDTRRLFGYILDHNDNIPHDKLSADFASTEEAWKSRTGSSYLQKSGKPVMSANCGSGGCNGECGAASKSGCSPGACSGECEGLKAGCGQGACNGECGTVLRSGCSPGACSGNCGALNASCGSGGCNGACGSCGTTTVFAT